MTPLRLTLPLLVAALLGLPAVAAARDTWRAPDGVEIKNGMTKAEVLGLLGKPLWADTLDYSGGPDGRRTAFYYLTGQPPLREALSLVFHGIYLRDIEVRTVGARPPRR